MPSGMLRGSGGSYAGSYAEQMSWPEFKKLAEHSIEMAKEEAKGMGITLRRSNSEIDAKVRRIVKVSGFNCSENKRHVEIGINIAATAMAMRGGEPEPMNLKSLLRW
jgi:hypothetical protein